MTDQRTATATPLTATVAVGGTVVAVLALGAASGMALPTVAGVGGAGLLVVAIRSLGREDDGYETTAIASLGLVCGSLLVGSGFLAVPSVSSRLLSPVLFVAAVVATFATGYGGLVWNPDATSGRITGVAVQSIIVMLAGLLVIPTAATGFALVVGIGMVVAVATVATATPFAGLVSLQVLGALFLLLLPGVIGILSTWLRGDERALESLPSHPSIPDTWSEGAPPWFVGLLGLQLFAAVLFPGALDAVLGSIPLLGPAIGIALASGLLHVPLALAVGVLVLVIAARSVQRVIVVWAAPDPPKRLGQATGGIVLTGISFVLTTASGLVPTADTWLVPTVAPTGIVVLVVGVVSLVGFVGMFSVLDRNLSLLGLGREFDFNFGVTPWFASASGALLFASGVGTLQGVAPPLVFLSVAAAFVVWDLGTTAVELGAWLGRTAETTRGEFVHVATSLGVATVGIVIATITVYVTGPLSVSIPDGRASLALVFSFVALLAFALALRIEPATDESSE